MKQSWRRHSEGSMHAGKVKLLRILSKVTLRREEVNVWDSLPGVLVINIPLTLAAPGGVWQNRM